MPGRSHRKGSRPQRVDCGVLDERLRPLREQLVAPVVTSPIGRVPPAALSALGLVSALGAAAAAAGELVVASAALWLFSRVCDALDGPVARARGLSSELGSVIDIVADTIGYAAIPIGIAIAADDGTTWLATAVLLASFYVNSMSLGYVAALLERRHARRPDALTSLAVPHGLIEGAETIVAFTLALAFPDAAATIWWVFAVLVFITAADRIVRTARTVAS